jgi:hypothetical protein
MDRTRRIEARVRETLELAGKRASRREVDWTNVRTGFDTLPDADGVVLVRWRARYDQIVGPNETRERLAEFARILNEAGFQVEAKAEEVVVRDRDAGV